LARIAGVDLPNEKKIETALTYIFGIGPTTSRRILSATGVDGSIRVKNLSEEDAARLRNEIENNYRVEGALHTEIGMNIKRLMDIGCYRGIRHRRGMPVHGQRTHTNARTRKGPRRSSGTVKKKPQPGKK
jgi:small subunit ribosomal protein S13